MMNAETKTSKKSLVVGCVLMAAGQARRFGRNKLLEPVEGRPMISHVLTQMRILASRQEKITEDGDIRIQIYAVTCWPQVAALCREFGIACREIAPGKQSDTIRAALSVEEAVRWQGCMFIAADQPFIREETMERMLAGFSRRPDCVHRAAFGESEGNPVLFPASCFTRLRTLRGDSGGREVLCKEGLPLILHQVQDPMELTDIDRQEDLSMSNKAITTPNAPAAIGPYSQAVQAGGTIYVSGQLPINPLTGEFAGKDIADQTRQSLQNIREILSAAGVGMENVVKTTVLMKDIADFAAMNEVYAEFFQAPFPARAAFQAAALPKDARVEIEAVAVTSDI